MRQAPSKILQKYSGVIGQAEDIVHLSGYAKTEVGYSGGGKLVAKLKLVNGAKMKLAANLPVSEPGYDGTPFYDFAVLPASMASVKVMVKQGPGSSVIYVDGVTFTVFTNAGETPREVLPVPSAP